MKISVIAAMDRENGLGCKNKLLCHLPNDLRYFKSTTMGKPIIMGYNTYLSIGKALPGRKNIVLTSKDNLEVENVYFVAGVSEALNLCADAQEVMIIGGASIYEQFLPQASKLYLTLIEHTFEADVFFPPVDFSKWSQNSEQNYPADDKSAYAYSFQVFSKII